MFCLVLFIGSCEPVHEDRTRIVVAVVKYYRIVVAVVVVVEYNRIVVAVVVEYNRIMVAVEYDNRIVVAVHGGGIQ